LGDFSLDWTITQSPNYNFHMPPTPHYLIIGNGAAGLSAAEVIRRRDSNGRITIVTNEPYRFYSRPGIAYYIMNQVSDRQLISRSENFYKEHRFNLHFGQVIRLDLDKQTVFFSDGKSITYDVLLLAVGSAAVPSPFPGSDVEGVLTFDTLDDAKVVIKQGRKAKTAVVVGGGITAMELSEGLRHQGARTILLQRGDRIWSRLFDERESTIIEQAATHEGVEIWYNEEIEEILGRKGKVAGVRLKSGKEIKCQVVGIAIGVRPNMELVKDLPVEQDRGVMVNEFMQSNIPNLFVAGDIAQVYDRWTKKHHLDVLWPSAINEGRAAGYNMVDVGHGHSPQFSYQKGSPFNAAMLYGIHLTVVGQISGSLKENDGESLSYLSRGSSQVWTAPFTSSHRSAWDSGDMDSIRIVMAEGRIVGTLLLGDQRLADPLRELVQKEADLTAYQDALLSAGDNLPDLLLKVWREWKSEG
jgi:NAD(P)H-nitrite reductase large subunit